MEQYFQYLLPVLVQTYRNVYLNYSMWINILLSKSQKSDIRKGCVLTVTRTWILRNIFKADAFLLWYITHTGYYIIEEASEILGRKWN